MKSFLTTCYAIACIIFLVISNSYWTNKTTIHIEASKNVTKVVAADRVDHSLTQLLPLTKNWPVQSVERLKQAIYEKSPFKISLVGSTALGGETGWAAQTKARLLESYGAEFLTVDIIEYDSTSTHFKEDEKLAQLVELNGDLILLEPFILNDNGEVVIEDSIANVTTIIETVKQTNPEVVFLLQPSYPIYKATRYPVQISELKKYAEENAIPFLDHWTAWPSADSEEVKEYLAADQSQPNENGHLLWSEFISNYFISK